MNILNLQEQKTTLSQTYTKNYNKLFSVYLKEVNKEELSIKERNELSNNFYKRYKKLDDMYEAEKYAIDIQDSPSAHTMYSSINYYQRFLINDMQQKLDLEYEELKKKLNSDNYSFFEKIDLKYKFKEFEQQLKDNISNQLSEFRQKYSDALLDKNYKKINLLEDSLLSTILSKI